MLVNLLGPIEAVTDDGAVGLGGAKQRAVLAMLALQTGSTVSADRLIDGLWGDHPPASALSSSSSTSPICARRSARRT